MNDQVTILEGGGICNSCGDPSTNVVHLAGDCESIVCKGCIKQAAELLGLVPVIHEGMQDAPKDRQFLAHWFNDWTIVEWLMETDDRVNREGFYITSEIILILEFTHWTELPADPAQENPK